MNNVFYKDDDEYPELLRQIGKDAPKQLYYKTRSSHLNFFERFTLKGSDAHQKESKLLASNKDLALKARPSRNKRGLKEQHPCKARLCEKGRAWSDFSDIFENCLTVIGSRRLTSYGKQVIERLVGEIALAGITIVSGFMYGGDAAAHKAALKAGGRTIAVMPCGIDRISPEDQEELYNDILTHNGLIVSEYKGDMAPALWTYPRRNRIAAGLSKALLIVEAGEKSGCLITANYAKKFNRKIFVAPGPITSSVSNGSNALIKQGAEMATEAHDILRWFRNLAQRRRPENDALVLKGHHFAGQASSRFKERPSRNRRGLKEQHPCKARLCEKGRAWSDPKARHVGEQILDLLERETMGIDELSRELEIPVSKLGTKLSMMEMKGIIKLRGNKYGVKN